MRSIHSAIVQFAADEGTVSALEVAERIQSSLETLLEIGSPMERQHAALLLREVNDGINTVCGRMPARFRN